MFEDTKWIIKIDKSKNRQYDGHQTINKKAKIGQQNTN